MSPARVWTLGLVMVASQLAFRAWVIYPSWFLFDDYVFLGDARDHPLDVSYLMTPYFEHPLPGGRLIAWVVAHSGDLNWSLAASGTLVMQAVASLAALWMLVVLFGARPPILVPLGLYLTSAMTMPGFTWWVAAFTLIPVQVAIFVATALWVMHLRTRRWLPLVGTAATIAVGLAFDVKAALTFPVLAFIAISYFASGSVVARVRTVVVRYRLGWGVLFLLGGLYTWYYLVTVPRLIGQSVVPALGGVLSNMLGTAFPSGAMGGPWHWDPATPPTALSDAPDVLVHLSWVVLGLVVVYLALRRTRTLRAWVLLSAYLLVLGVLLTGVRGNLGPGVGREFRYLTEATCILTLCLGLATMTLPGAVESSTPRTTPLVAPAPRILVVALVVGVLVSGVVNSATYAHIWHTQNAGDAYMHRLAADVSAAGQVDLAETRAPESVLTPLLTPLNNTRTLAPLVTGRVDFPTTSPQLAVVGPEGGLYDALIRLGVESEKGPIPGCGWLVTEDGAEIPLRGRAFFWTWWVRIGYLSSANDTIEVTMGSQQRTAEVVRGVHSLYAYAERSFDSVRIDGVEPGTTLCVDTIEVGEPVPGGPL